MQDEEIHIGQLVKSVFDSSHLSVSELARKLHCDRSNVYSIFQRRSVDVELLAKLSKILNYNFLEEAMRLYELPPASAPKLKFDIILNDIDAEKLHRLTELLKELKA
ncbi:MAG: XRE family transcriptional regulator [Bacteroidales bacterium]|nr:XRE family transcriptional regulator [Bacteroidales bacterium]